MDSWLIGSAPDCDIIVDQPSVSGHHCRLIRKPDGFYLEDLNSTNGTFIAGEKLTSIRRVTAADSITLGRQTVLPWPAAAVEEKPVEDKPVADKAPATAPAVTGSPSARSKFLIPAIPAISVVAVMLLLLGAYAIWGRKSPDDQAKPEKEPAGPVAEQPVAEQPVAQPDETPQDVVVATPQGFRMGNLEATTVIKKIRATISVGGVADDLVEPVNLHLGLGFPLRLYPVGTEKRDPAFAAIPQRTSLKAGETIVFAGDAAWFEFTAKPTDNGQDELRATPQLLTDLRVADIQHIGFASPGETDWELAGYKIEINGETYAENDTVFARAKEIQSQNQAELERLLTEAEPLARQVAELEAFAEVGLASDTDKTNLASAQQKLKPLEDPIKRLNGQINGMYAWFSEQDPGFQPAPLPGSRPQMVTVKLLAGGRERPGSQNPVYLKAGGRKFLLTSESDPLDDQPELQEFVIPREALQTDPISLADLRRDKIGVGIVAHDGSFNTIPDRAKLQRVTLEADGKETYDSEQNAQDRNSLAAVSLVPPAHRDHIGFVVDNKATPNQVHLWTPGLAVPVDQSGRSEPPPEPPPLGLTGIGDLGLGGDGSGGGKPGAGGGGKPGAGGGGKPSAGGGGRPGAGGGGKPGAGGGGKPGAGGGGKPGSGGKPGGGNPRSRRPIKFINNIINNNFGNKGKSKKPGDKAKPKPGPTAPKIANVRIKPQPGKAIQIGQPCEVTWDVLGNDSQVEKYRVELVPVLPHLPPAVRAPMGFTQVNSFERTAQVAATVAAVPVNDRPFLYVQPRVTAMRKVGNGLRPMGGATNNGPILPIFPAARTPIKLYRTSGIRSANTQPLFPLVTGGANARDFPQRPDFSALNNPPGGSFAVFNVWLPADVSPPLPGTVPIPLGQKDPATLSEVGPLDAPQESHSYNFDAYPPLAGASFAFNTKVQPSNATNVIWIQFTAIGVERLPSRVVAHFGLLDQGGPGRVDACVQIVDDRPPFKTRRWIHTGKLVPKITSSAAGATNLSLINIPLGPLGGPALRPPGSGYELWFSNGPGPGRYRGLLHPTPPDTVAIIVTFMISRGGAGAPATEGLGLFGARLVN